MCRFLPLFLVVLSISVANAQRGRGPSLVGVWNETSLDRYGEPVRPEYQPNRTVLIMDADGYFEEIRPRRTRYSNERRYQGRWSADYRTGDLELLVDGNTRTTARPSRYRTRRSVQRIPYSIVFSDRNELVLRDRRNGRKRIFVKERLAN
ncbi:MAG: hypothetical protein ACI81P_002240 [Neolewinella sp.]|jgi:hypothetical protein